jgi:hypothetical protein
MYIWLPGAEPCRKNPLPVNTVFTFLEQRATTVSQEYMNRHWNAVFLISNLILSFHTETIDLNACCIRAICNLSWFDGCNNIWPTAWYMIHIIMHCYFCQFELRYLNASTYRNLKWRANVVRVKIQGRKALSKPV